MIDSISLHSLRNAEFLRFLKNVLAIYLANNPDDLQVREQYDALVAIVATLDPLFKAEQGSAMTDDLKALDERRDVAITGIGMFVMSMTYYFDVDIKKQAGLLAANLALYGTGIAKQNYQTETELISSIVADWTNKPELAAAVTALQMGDWQAELETANNDFDKQYLARTQELGAASPDKMKTKRTEAADVYYALRDFTDSYYTINKGAEPYATVVGGLNALIAQYNALLAGRAAAPGITAGPATADDKG